MSEKRLATPQCSVILPSTTRIASTVSNWIALPVGAMPKNSPSCVPWYVLYVVTRLPSAACQWITAWKSGNAPRSTLYSSSAPALSGVRPGCGVWSTKSSANNWSYSA